MKYLIIAEKSSVGASIADILDHKIKNNDYIEGIYDGKNYIVTWARGHLLQLYDCKDYDCSMIKWQMDAFPFIPEKFKYKIGDAPCKKRMTVIRSLIKRNDVGAIISALDADREGELISKTILDYLKIKKPVYRLYHNEWTTDEVKAGLKNLIPNEDMKKIADAAESRQWSDWIIGINLTSVATLKYSRVKGRNGILNVGRVILPTLKIVYDRDKVIENFIPQNYFKLFADFITSEGSHFEGTFFDVKNKKDKFSNEDTLKKIQPNLENGKGIVIDKNVNIKNEEPPSLFSLTTLQSYVTSKNPGWSAAKALEIAQKLYENKVITYPRTESMFLEESLTDKANQVFELLKKDSPFKTQLHFKVSKRIFNSKKVSGHSALIPTYILPEKLTPDEAAVYNAIKNRFLIQFMEPAKYEDTKILICVNNSFYFFLKGRIEKQKGWKALETINSKEITLPKINLMDEIPIYSTVIKTFITKPPEHHSYSSLLDVMRYCGRHINKDSKDEIMDSILSGFTIGAPSTRAETIERLKSIGYIYQKNKYLYCSELGKVMVETFPVKALFDLKYTGHMEKLLSDIEKGILSKDTYLKMIYDFTIQSINEIKNDSNVIIRNEPEFNKKPLGKCPICGDEVIETKNGFICRSYKKTCDFAIWKNDKYMALMGKKVTQTIVKNILNSGKARIMNLTSKKGKKFDAYFKYVKKTGSKYYSWVMLPKHKTTLNSYWKKG